MKRTVLKGFTIVELLIVIAILGMLAVALLITINPGEAQKKTRDAQRVIHMKSLQTLIEQFINDGRNATGAIITNAGANSSTKVAQNSETCGVASWIQIDTCLYGASIPLDPNNRTQRTFVTNATTNPATTGLYTAQYRAKIAGSDYEVNAMQESRANSPKIANDGGNSAQWFEGGTDLTLL